MFAVSLFQQYHPAPLAPYILPLVFFIILAFCEWLVEKYIPMADPLKITFRVLVVIVVVFWLLKSFGLI